MDNADFGMSLIKALVFLFLLVCTIPAFLDAIRRVVFVWNQVKRDLQMLEEINREDASINGIERMNRGSRG